MSGRPTTFGLFPGEQAILDLYDDNASVFEIARMTGASMKKVRNTIAIFGGSVKSDRAREAALRAGTVLLLTRIREVHPDMTAA